MFITRNSIFLLAFATLHLYHFLSGNGMMVRPRTICTQSGRTALIRAANGGHTECARLLIEGGADVNAQSNVRGKSFFISLAFFCLLSAFAPFHRGLFIGRKQYFFWYILTHYVHTVWRPIVFNLRVSSLHLFLMNSVILKFMNLFLIFHGCLGARIHSFISIIYGDFRAGIVR